MIRRLLSNQPIPKEPTQRENIFHTRCKILENTCSLIVDSGSCSNYYSTRLVDKLAMTIIPHPKPYKLMSKKVRVRLLVRSLMMSLRKLPILVKETF